MSAGGVDRLALGLAALGRPAYINLGRDGELPAERTVDEMRAASWAVLDGAYAAGVRWVDVARSYGRAEEFLAGWLAARGQPELTVSSKWGYAYVGEWRMDAQVHELKEHSAARLREQYAESRKLLGDRLDLYQVHSLTPDSPLFTDRELLGLLAELAESGPRLGFSTSGPNQADAIERALELGLFSAVQSTWNPLEPSAGDALAAAHAAGCHVIVKEALANGRLVVTAPPAVDRLATEYGVGQDAVALAAALAQPWADTVLLGPAGVGQLRANLAALDVPIDRAELADLAEDPADYWKQRSALAWN
ncbi:aldo/keto reductase [Pseudonocardia eucalypti]|uniref:Aldo/keto reductase n=1 Tax=Pseudonocardia eucalypti TaxID=648755 RepID=A0ABP9PKB6_9PSEU|nr:aryl-alcohol dehydrogenase-like predicted oxidoreductase [Pseudonocardia eucalypti]